MTKDDIIAAAVALELPEHLIACHLPALQRLAAEAGRRACIVHAQEVLSELNRIEKWRGLAMARDGDGPASPSSGRRISSLPCATSSPSGPA